MSKWLSERISVLIPGSLLIVRPWSSTCQWVFPNYLPDPRPHHQLDQVSTSLPRANIFPPHLQSDTCTYSPPFKTAKLVFSLLSGSHILPKTTVIVCQSSAALMHEIFLGLTVPTFLLNPAIMFEWTWLERETGKGTQVCVCAWSMCVYCDIPTHIWVMVWLTLLEWVAWEEHGYLTTYWKGVSPRLVVPAVGAQEEFCPADQTRLSSTSNNYLSSLIANTCEHSLGSNHCLNNLHRK